MASKILNLFNIFKNHPLRRFKKTIFEGHTDYGDHIFNDIHPSQSAEEKAAKSSMNLSLFIGGDVLLGVLATWTSIAALGWATVAAAVVGGALYIRDFFCCRKKAHDVIVEVNLAGQHVQGERRDLCRLHEAQKEIVNLSMEFGSCAGAGLKTALKDKIDKIIEKMSPEVSRVKVTDAGLHHASKDNYTFASPSLHAILARKTCPAK